MKNKLIPEPCPFCGSKDLTMQTSIEDREGVPINVLCQDCGCAGPWTYLERGVINDAFDNNTIPAKLIKLWNKRNEN